MQSTYPTWSDIRPLTSDVVFPVMQIGFVTNQVTVNSVMKNFASLVDQLEQEYLYVFCGEGYIYLKRPEEFQKRIPMMGSFHVTK